MEPLVTVKVLTYNHVEYIKACLDGILMQKTDFPFDVIIGDDCSTDGTTEIILKYQNDYPDKVKVITNKKNVGYIRNSQSVYNVSKGKYIAICDGDDYWNDPYKLQKQVSFLESHPDYGMAYSDINMVNEKNEIIETTKQHEELKKLYKSGYIFGDLLQHCFINTLTVVVRKEILGKIFSLISKDEKKYWFVFDYWWWMKISKDWKIKFFNEKMATYRVHENGISSISNFYQKRGPLAKLDVLISINNDNIVTQEQKNIVGKIAGGLIYNTKIGFRNNLKALKIFMKYPPSVPFMFSIMEKKIKRLTQ